jgi:hypothetical protein
MTGSRGGRSTNFARSGKKWSPKVFSRAARSTSRHFERAFRSSDWELGIPAERSQNWDHGRGKWGEGEDRRVGVGWEARNGTGE